MRQTDLETFTVRLQETDLQIGATLPLREDALAAAAEARRLIVDHGRQRPEFLASLLPLEAPPGCPDIVASMYAAGAVAGVGPMAAVAGAVAEYVGRALLRYAAEVIVENGGDIFLSTQAPRTVAIGAGRSVLSGKLGLAIPAGSSLGICTSSGTVGPSLSFGQADAALVACDDTALADALATGLGNRVSAPGEVEAALAWIQGIAGVRQAIVIIGETLGAWGEFPLVQL